MHPGNSIPELVKRIGIVQNVMYGAATWDFHRIHYDPKLVQTKGFPKPFADGQMLGSFLAYMLTDWMGTGGTIKRLKLNYREMAFVGDVLTCRGRVSSKQVENGENLVLCDLWIENQKGERIISDASAIVFLPSKTSAA